MDLNEELVAKAKARHLAAASVAPEVRVEFRHEDILLCPLKRPPDMLAERFDVILLLSVTKWVHFTNGDWGIRRLFKRCVKRLKPGGCLVLEPQEWYSYKKKMRLSAEKFAGMELRPQDFPKYLEELGLVRQSTIEPPKDVSKGWQRPIYLFTRPQCEEEEEEAAPEVTQEERKEKKKAGVEKGDAEEAQIEANREERKSKKKARREKHDTEEAVAEEETVEESARAKKRSRKQSGLPDVG